MRFAFALFNGGVQFFKRHRRNINGVGSTVFGLTVDIAVDFFGQLTGFFDDFIAGPDGLNILRAGFDTGGQLPRLNLVVAAVAFEHHAVAGKIGQDIQIQPHAGLALRDVPGANRIAFGAPQADFRVYSGDTVLKLFGGSPGA